MEGNYEYKIFSRSSKYKPEKIINEKSSVGWKLVDVKITEERVGTNTYKSFYVVMKKPKKASWFWKKKSEKDWDGPVEWKELVREVKNGELKNNDLVWQRDFDRWKRVDSVESLADWIPSSNEHPPPIQDDAHEVKEKNRNRLSESEALSCIHKYDKDEQGDEYCKKCGWYRHSLKSINS
ncbi:DUF4339 domain-containing protein [Salinibacter ruber]|uniref:GYF domain-containing protein n=1 Tax=Salinibacter ruber TaxID=146919 RepID=A0A9X2ZMB1_9BACT|nr:hypothetical protein [Salinibacter ruber]MCS3866365.1 hypothetical protein [Salinibacter ruber]